MCLQQIAMSGDHALHCFINNIFRRIAQFFHIWGNRSYEIADRAPRVEDTLSAREHTRLNECSMAVRICPNPEIVKAKAVAKPEFGIRNLESIIQERKTENRD